jgi:glycosyltransferase involved in cell wall biosynthesis
MSKKILFFIKVPPPTTGATLINMYVLESEILKKAFDVSILPISYIKSRKSMGKFEFSKILIIFSVFFKLLRELIFNRPKVIYFQISPKNLAFIRDLLYVSLIKIFRVKIVYHLHGKGIKNIAKSKVKGALYRYAFKNSDIIILSSLLSYDIKDVFNGKVHIVHNGIPDVVSLINVKNKKSLPLSPIKLVFLSNLIMAKGILDYIKTLKLLKKSKIKFEGIIVGAEADLSEKEINIIIERESLKDDLKYIGPKYGKDKYDILAHSDMLIYPTTNDAFPLVVLEAMQFSLPIIATEEGAIPEIIEDGVTGFLVEKNNPNQIVDKIKYLLENPDLIDKMGIESRKKYEQEYTLGHFERNIKAVFDRIFTEID